MLYRKNNTPTPSKYELHPYGLVYHRGSLYIVAFSIASQEMRHFKLDRVQAAECLDETFERPETFDAGEYLERSFGIFSPTNETYSIRIWFAAKAADAVRESQWHNSQKILEHDDGSISLSLELSNLEEVKSWVLGFGSMAKVLAPNEFVALVRDDIQKMAEGYQ